MYPLMNRCVDKLVAYMDKVTEASGDGIVNVKEMITGFTIDVVGSTNFGLDPFAPNDKTNAQNAFVQNGVMVWHFNPVRLGAVFALPRRFLHIIGIKTIFPDDALEFFVNLCKSVIQDRKEQANAAAATKRNDLLQLLMDAFVYEKELKNMTNFDQLTVDIESEGRIF